MHRLNVVRECGTGDGATRRFRSSPDGSLAYRNYLQDRGTRPPLAPLVLQAPSG
jgi:hypothetical protein